MRRSVHVWIQGGMRKAEPPTCEGDSNLNAAVITQAKDRFQTGLSRHDRPEMRPQTGALDAISSPKESIAETVTTAGLSPRTCRMPFDQLVQGNRISKFLQCFERAPYGPTRNHEVFCYRV